MPSPHVPIRFTGQFVALLLLAWLVSGFAGCNQPVTDRGVPITNQTLVTAAQAAHVAEVAIVVAEDALTAGIQSGLIPHATGQTFAEQIRPKIALALREAKNLLVIANETPMGTNTEKILATVTALQQAVVDVQSFLMDAQKGTK